MPHPIHVILRRFLDVERFSLDADKAAGPRERRVTREYVECRSSDHPRRPGVPIATPNTR